MTQGILKGLLIEPPCRCDSFPLWAAFFLKWYSFFEFCIRDAYANHEPSEPKKSNTHIMSELKETTDWADFSFRE